MTRNPKHPISMRLPEATIRQIEELAPLFGGANNLIALAVDRIYQTEIANKTEINAVIAQEKNHA
jgi:hypothetical protein